MEAPYTVVTMDADGQHLPEDAARICAASEAEPDALILGGRKFEGKVPLRSRFGNGVTRWVFRLSTGAKVYDTQTGLRAFSDRLLPAMLDVYANGFLAASVYTALNKRLGQQVEPKVKVFFSALLVLCVCLLILIAQGQAGAQDIQRGQMARRFPLSAVLACFMVCAAFSAAPSM